MFLHTKKCFFTQKIFLHTKCVFFTNKMFFYKKKVFFTYKMFLHKKLFFSQIFGRIDIWLDVRIWRKKDGVSCQLNKKRSQLWIWLYIKEYEGKQMLRAMDCYMNLNQKKMIWIPPKNGFQANYGFCDYLIPFDQEEEETILVTTMSFTFGFFFNISYSIKR